MRGLEIAITGMGCVSPCGSSVERSWEAIVQGRSGIAPIEAFDTAAFDVHIAGEVKGFQPEAYGIDPKEARRLDRFAHFGIAAAEAAVRQSGILEGGLVPERTGVMVGTGIGGIRSIETQMDILRRKGPSRVSPLLVPSGTPDVAANEIALVYGLK